MKRWICLALSVVMIFSLCGCQLQNTAKAPSVEQEETGIEDVTLPEEQTAGNVQGESTIEKEEHSGISVDVGGFEKIPEDEVPKEEPEVEEEKPEEPKKVAVQIETSDKDFSKIQQISGNIGKKIKLYGDIEESEDIAELAEILGSYNKNISIAAMSLTGDKALAYNTKQGYFSACTIKTAYILSCCKQIDEGAVDKDTLLTYKKKHYHDGSGQIRKEKYGKKYTIEYLIQQSLYISDNVAYAMLIDYFGFEYYNKMISKLGCSSIKLHDMWARSAKVKDYVILWNEVYNYFNSKTEMAKVMKKACTNTPFNYGTRTLGVSYSHKSGDNFGAAATYSDAGIVWSKEPYIYVVFTNSEGKTKDEKTVDRSMEIIYELFRK